MEPLNGRDVEQVTDGELILFSVRCVEWCAREFKRADKMPPPFELLRGDTDQPWYRMGDSPAIIVTRTDHYGSLRLQVAHEVFHWLCTPATAFPGVFHWTHEMLAIHTSLACIRLDNALHEYANENEKIFREEAGVLTVRDMLTTPLSNDPVRSPYPDGLFGQAFEVGVQLKAKVGWQRLKQLATYFDSIGKTPDLRAWVNALPAQRRSGAVRILDAPGGRLGVMADSIAHAHFPR